MTWGDVIKRVTESKEPVVQDFDDKGPIEGMYWHRGEIKTKKSGTFPAWILKDHQSSGEQCGAIILMNGLWWPQELIPKGSIKDLFPYQYRLEVPCEGDIHQSEMY